MPKNPDCTECPLHQTARSVCVWGEVRGNVEADYPTVMVLGEAPGFEEDQADRPFIGRSGELLTEAMATAGIERYYTTNTLKCFPGKKGKPDKSHAKACSHYLDDELENIKPKYILALGNVAVQRLLGRGKVTEIAGRETWSEKYQCFIYPEVHPAFILRNEGRKSSWVLSLHRFARLVQGELFQKPPVNVRVIEFASELSAFTEELLLHAEAGLPFSYDCEFSYGKDWWHKEFKMYTIAFSLAVGDAVVVPVHHPESDFSEHMPWFWKRIRPAMANGKAVRVAHHMMADDLAIYREAGYRPVCSWDTMVAWHCLDENAPKRLKWLGRALLGWPDWGIDTKDLASTPLKDVGFYNGCDAAATLQVYDEEQRRFAEEEPGLLRYFLNVPMKYIPELEKMVINGVHIDLATLGKRASIAMEQKNKAALEIPVKNPGSTQQLAKWLFEDKKLPILKETPTGNPSTDADVIKRLARDFPAAKKVLEYRTPTKQLGAYFEPFFEMVRDSIDHRAHFDYNPTGTETGRLSGRVHTTPRDPFVRNCVSAPPGWVLVQGDLAQAEARLAGWSAVGKPPSWKGVPPDCMISAFRNGVDVYVETAAEALGKRPEDVIRDKSDPNNERQMMGKVPTLASLYMISPKGLMEYAWEEYEIVYTIEQATILWAAFLKRWSEFPAWHAREGAIIKSRGWNRSAIGRKRRVPEAMGIDKYTAEAAVRSALNMPIQGLTADIAKATLIRLSSRLDPKTAFVVAEDHDALLFEVREDRLEKLLPALTYAMENAWKEYRPLGLELPEGLIKVDMSIGPWGGRWSG